MHVRGALRVACYHLLLLGVFGKHSNHHGTSRNMSPHPSRLDRSHRHHLPTYMMHLYRHFKLNQTQPENVEHEQADTIKSILSKSKIWHLLWHLLLHLKTGTSLGSFVGGLCGSWLSNLSARHLQSTSRTNALRKADVD